MNNTFTTKPIPDDTKKVFRKKGACSQTLFYLLNRHFDNLDPESEKATDPLAGGILQYGHQCGMLWGAIMAVGAEAYRRYDDQDKASAIAIIAGQKLMESFRTKENTVNCKDITRCDFHSKWSFAKYFFSGRFLHCFRLAEDWVPEAIAIAEKELTNHPESVKSISTCTGEVIKSMGGDDRERVIVSGLAGGMALSGEACGALATAIWKRVKDRSIEDAKRPAYKDPACIRLYQAFVNTTDGRIRCQDICGKKFHSPEDHSAYIRQGGCKHLIDLLSVKTASDKATHN